MTPSHPMIYQMPDKKLETINQINQACYDHCANQWDRFPFPDILPLFIQKYYQPSLGQAVLDVGSGTGMLAQWLKDQGFDVLCIDPSLEMVRRCKAKGLQAKQITLQEFVHSGSFGMIFAILSLIHIPKDDFSFQLKKLAAILPNDGLLFLGMLEGRGEKFCEGPQYPRFFAYYSRQEIEDKVKPYFTVVDYHYTKVGIGYMLFVLKKKKNVD